MVVEDKNDVILSQYDFDIKRIYRVRGAVVVDTDKGLKILREYQMSGGKAEFENCIMQHLKQYGFENVDYISRNKEGSLISENQYGTRFIIKDYFPGEECSLKNEQDVLLAVKKMAGIHTILHGVDFSFLKEACEKNKFIEVLDDEEKLIENNEYRMIVPKKDIKKMLMNHDREIRRVQRYICDKKKRNEFEVEYLKVYSEFSYQGDQALDIINSFNYNNFLMENVNASTIYHGEFTQHNVVYFQKNNVSGVMAASMDGKACAAITGFEKAGMGAQIYDFYYFLRKTMEKNQWDLSLGMKMLDRYVIQREINGKCVNGDEMKTLHALISFPDKLWKITDYYYNRRKAWISARMISKLEKLKDQEKMRHDFIEKFRREYIV